MRKIALLLALLMVFGALFVSCGEKDSDKDDQNAGYVLLMGSYKSLTGSSFESSDEKIVKVLRDNLMYAAAPGTATVTGKEGDKTVEYTVEVIGLDNVTLGKDYKNVSLKEVQKTVDNAVADLISKNVTFSEVTDRKDVRKGDKVNITYVGKMEGKEFDGGSGTYDLEIGSNSFIAGFEDGLIGKENGTTVDLNLNFPNPYPNSPDLAGKPVVFTVTINKISAPEEYSDAFVKKITGYETIEEYEAYLKRLAATDIMFMEISSKSVINEIPQSLKNRYYNEYIEEYINYMKSMGISVTTKEEIMKLMGFNDKSFDEMVNAATTEQMKQDYVLHRFCQENNLNLTDELYQKQLEKYLKQYDCKDEAALLKKYSISLDTLYSTFLYETVLDYLYEQAVIVDDLNKDGSDKTEKEESAVRVEYSSDMLKWNVPADKSEMFGDVYWEPGVVKIVYMKVTNTTSEAIDYKLVCGVASETGAVNVNGDFFELSDYVKAVILDANDKKTYATRDEAMAAANAAGAKPIKENCLKTGTLNASEIKYVAVIVYMPETVGNEANASTSADKQPALKLGFECQTEK